MFRWFRKKQEPAAPPPPQETEPVPAPEPTLEDRMLRMVAERFPNAALEGNSLHFPDCNNLSMTVRFSDLDGPRFRMKARLEHPDFFGPLLESVAWAAESDEDKARFAAEQISDTVLDALLPALKKPGETVPPVQLWGREHLFTAHVSGVVLVNAQQPPEGRDLWSLMKQAVLDCLGTKKIYWVKLYLARIGTDTASCEVRINGWVVPELTRTLVELAKHWPAETAPLQSAKQYVILVQDETTYSPCPYSWKQALELTRYAIRLFETGTAYDQIPQALEAASPDPSLAEDVFSFMPELMTKCLLQDVKTASQFSLVPPSGEAVSLWCTQCRAWTAVYQAVCDHLGQDHPSREQWMTIVGNSAMSHTLRNALNAGSHPEDLILFQSFQVSERYTLW